MILIYIQSIIISFIGKFGYKKLPIIWLFPFLTIILFIAGEVSHSDSFNYYISYINAHNIHIFEDSEFGYLLLEKIGLYLKFSYPVFRLFIVIMGHTLIFSTAKKYSLNIEFIYFNYLIYLLFIDSIQLRNFLAFSLIVYGIRFLIEDSSYGVFKYLIIVLISSTIHSSMVVYSIFLLLKLPNVKIIKNTIIVSTIILMLIIFLNNNEIPFINNFLEMINTDDNRIHKYFMTATNLGFLVPFFGYLLNLTILKISNHLYIKKMRTMPKDNLIISKRHKVLDFILQINEISIVFLVLIMLNINFTRLIRNLVILNLIALSIVFGELNKNKIKQLIYSLIIILNMFLWFYIDFIYYNVADLAMFFSENFFLK